jgi:acyl transferase domain-containing protein
VRTTRATSTEDNVFARMRLEHEQETARAVAAAAAATAATQTQANTVSNEALSNTQQRRLHGETVYDLAPVTTYEYDVVKCADFVLDQGCWVRHMPEAIRLANPNFVPT